MNSNRFRQRLILLVWCLALIDASSIIAGDAEDLDYPGCPKSSFLELVDHSEHILSTDFVFTGKVLKSDFTADKCRKGSNLLIYADGTKIVEEGHPRFLRNQFALLEDGNGKKLFLLLPAVGQSGVQIDSRFEVGKLISLPLGKVKFDGQAVYILGNSDPQPQASPADSWVGVDNLNDPSFLLGDNFTSKTKAEFAVSSLVSKALSTQARKD